MIKDIARKLAQANSELEGQKAALVKAVTTDGTNAKYLSPYLNALAEAEGKVALWSRVNDMALYQSRQGSDTTAEMVALVVADVLSSGADDSWSGRGNDVRRARFDGIRSAAQDARYL